MFAQSSAFGITTLQFSYSSRITGLVFPLPRHAGFCYTPAPHLLRDKEVAGAVEVADSPKTAPWAGPAGSGRLDPIEHRTGGDLRLPQSGQQPELARERAAAGGRTQPARERSANHDRRVARAAAEHLSRHRPRSGAHARANGPRPVLLPVGRGGSDSGAIPESTVERSAGRPEHVGPRARAGNRSEDRGPTGAHPHGQSR